MSDRLADIKAALAKHEAGTCDCSWDGCCMETGTINELHPGWSWLVGQVEAAHALLREALLNGCEQHMPDGWGHAVRAVTDPKK